MGLLFKALRRRHARRAMYAPVGDLANPTIQMGLERRPVGKPATDGRVSRRQLIKLAMEGPLRVPKLGWLNSSGQSAFLLAASPAPCGRCAVCRP